MRMHACYTAGCGRWGSAACGMHVLQAVAQGDGVESTGVPRMATAQPAQREPQTREETVAVEGFQPIARAGRLEAAGGAQKDEADHLPDSQGESHDPQCGTARSFLHGRLPRSARSWVFRRLASASRAVASVASSAPERWAAPSRAMKRKSLSDGRPWRRWRNTTRRCLFT